MTDKQKLIESRKKNIRGGRSGHVYNLAVEEIRDKNTKKTCDGQT